MRHGSGHQGSSEGAAWEGGRETYTKHRTGVHGPPDGSGPWTTPWTRSVDPVRGPPHGPPLILKRTSPLLI